MSCTAEQLRSMSPQADDLLLLVTAMLHRFPQQSHEKEELYQQGCIGLMKALSRYDPACDTSFSAYSASMILQEMHQLCRLDTPYRLYQSSCKLSGRVKRAEALLTLRLRHAPSVGELSRMMRLDPAELLLGMECAQPVLPAAAPRKAVKIALIHTSWIKAVNLSNVDLRLLLLRHRFGYTQAETAWRLGLSPAQVSRREMAIKRSLSHTAQQR